MDRFTRGERLTLAAAVTVAAGAGIFAWTNFTRAFPEAHLSFTVNRATSEPVATAFLAEHAPAAAGALAGRSHAAIFRVDDGAKVYLEREVGLDRLGVLTRERQVRLWSWAHRWYRPLAKEEVRVQVTPEGEVMGFAHLVPEEVGGASLDEAAAHAAAETFLASAFKLDPGKLTFVESKREDRPHRRDWTFTYERTGWKVKDATYRMQVEVHGDEPAGYKEYLKVPDAWTQGYQRLRSANDTTALVAAFGIVLTLLAALVVVFREGRRGNVHWRLPMLLTALAFGLFVLMSLNELPVASYGFDTTGTYGAFLAGQLLRAIGGAGVQALLIFLVVAAGEPLFRARFPGHLRITALFERSGWRNRRFAYGLILGYCLAAVFLAYQVAFYLVGARFGAWNPADVPFDNLLNTSFPWLAVLFVGFYPAVSEEFMSRVFSIPLVDKLTHSRVASVVIPALIWGFAHANYPAPPFYIRGVEVSIAGLFVGIILYRFGVVPCLVWHYVVDAGYTSMLLVRSGNPYFVVTAFAGVGALLVPLAATLIAAWRRGGFVDDPGALNAADPAPPAPPAVAPVAAAPIVTPPVRRVVAIGLALAAAGGVLAWMAPDPGRGVGVRMRPDAVRRAAAAFLAARAADPARWRFVVTASGDVLGPAIRRYLLEHGGVPKVVRFAHELREEAPGANLPLAEARRKAEAALAAAGIDVAKLEFKEARSQKRPARTDDTFTWRDPKRGVGDAEYLIEVGVQGDAVDSMTRRIKLPEAWERAYERRTVLQIARLAVTVGVLALVIIHGLLVFYRGVRAGAVPWRRLFVLAAGLGVLVGVGLALRLPLDWAGYDPSSPEALFRTTTLIRTAIQMLLIPTAVVLALGALAACFPAAAAATGGDRRRAVLATAAAALAVVGAGLAVRGVAGLARSWAPLAFPDAPVAIPGSVATWMPALAGLGAGLVGAALQLTLVGFAVHLWRELDARWLKVALGVGLLLALVPAGSDASLPEFAAGVVHLSLIHISE